jgi:hypothetical protein
VHSSAISLPILVLVRPAPRYYLRRISNHALFAATTNTAIQPRHAKHTLVLSEQQRLELASFGSWLSSDQSYLISVHSPYHAKVPGSGDPPSETVILR